MANTYRAALIGCSRMGAFIDNEVTQNRSMRLPYSHAAGYEACERTDLVAGADLRPDVLEQFGARYNVGSDHWYTNYRDLIASEKPDIVSIATQPEQRCEIILHAIEHGVRALYVEKPLCASVAEAELIRDAVKANNVAFNMGTNRRYHNGYAAMRAKIESGDFGALRSVIAFSTGPFFNTASHFFDVLVYLNSDVAPQWVQAQVFNFDELVVGSEVREDPAGTGIIGFENGVFGYAVDSSRRTEFEAICASGVITGYNNGLEFRTRTHTADESADGPSLEFENTSSTLNLVKDLVHALDTGEPTRGGADVAYWNTQIIFGFIESHRRGGARVELPLTDHDLRFIRRDHVARRPKYEAG
jgi:predicted dehydrogenase